MNEEQKYIYDNVYVHEGERAALELLSLWKGASQKKAHIEQEASPVCHNLACFACGIYSCEQRECDESL